MRSLFIYSVTFGLILASHAQDAESTAETSPNSEQIQKAIDEFNRSRQNEPNEVTVVLPPQEPSTHLANPVADESFIQTADYNETKESVVTNEPPQVDVTPEAPAGLNVRVEEIRAGSGKIDPAKIQLKANFPVKALTTIPEGWKLEISQSPPAFTREIEIKPETFVKIEITPHVLSPDSDGSEIFSVLEPGYNHESGYQQDQAVATILEKSITQLDTDSIKMGNALSELHRLLASLPRSEAPSPNETSDTP